MESDTDINDCVVADDIVCGICFDPVKLYDVVPPCPCGFVICHGCIKTLILKTPSPVKCPACRRVYKSADFTDREKDVELTLARNPSTPKTQLPKIASATLKRFDEIKTILVDLETLKANMQKEEEEELAFASLEDLPSLSCTPRLKSRKREMSRLKRAKTFCGGDSRRANIWDLPGISKRIRPTLVPGGLSASMKTGDGDGETDPESLPDSILSFERIVSNSSECSDMSVELNEIHIQLPGTVKFESRSVESSIKRAARESNVMENSDKFDEFLRQMDLEAFQDMDTEFEFESEGRLHRARSLDFLGIHFSDIAFISESGSENEDSISSSDDNDYIQFVFAMQN